MSDALVLIVDDSLTVRMDLQEAFEEASFHVLLSSTLAQARSLLASERVDVVVLDVLLPDGDGLGLLAEIRSSPNGGPIVLLLSAEAEVSDRIRGLRTGADDYVGKPYDRGYLVSKARQLLRAGRSTGVQVESSVSILIIDDSVTFREELRDTLERRGHRVTTASTGEEGLRLAADLRPDAILVDGVLPGIDGATVIRRIRFDAALRQIPCLLLTATDDLGAELVALDAGADAFVRKQGSLDVILAKLDASLRRAETPANRATASVLGPKKILACDDSATYLDELAGAMRGEGYEVILARSGEEALLVLSVERVDCILLDLMMPGIGGRETCRRIKAAPIVRDVPLIILTALDDKAVMIEGLSAGADDYISKSSDFEVLRARVRAQLRRRQFEDENRSIREQLLLKELEITEARAQRELAETRAALVAELEAKNQELEAFSYSVSHDLRAPLRAVGGFARILERGYADKLDAKGRDHVHRIRSGAQRMSTLIDDLLNLSKVGRVGFARQVFDLSALALSVLDELRRKDAEREVEIAVAPGLEANADLGLVRILLENLLGNAWKFTSKRPRARIEVGFSAEEQSFYVRDDGDGFDPAYAERLFTPFQRLHSESEFPGTGIGLATVRRVVDRHGGRLFAHSNPGKGATFSFSLGAATKKESPV